MRKTTREKPNQEQLFDQHSNSYRTDVDDAVLFADVDFFTRVKANYTVDLLAEHFAAPTELSVLDVGCGIGLSHSLIAQKVGTMHGVDVSAESIEVAKTKNPEVKYEVSSGADLPYPSGAFDAVLTVCVLHHVLPSAWHQFLAEMHRVVKPGGIALVFEHNPTNPLTQKVVDRCPFDEDAVLLKANRTVDLLQSVGFNRTKARYILALPAANNWLRRVDRLFSRLPFGAQYYAIGHKN